MGLRRYSTLGASGGIGYQNYPNLSLSLGTLTVYGVTSNTIFYVA